METAPPTNGAHLIPVPPGERTPIVDILRGFAIFGILVVDLPAFAGPTGLPGHVPSAAGRWIDVLATGLTAFLAEGKFYVIFSFLFGLGFFLQRARAQPGTEHTRGLFRRRLWLLLGLGCLHAILLWTADILRMYAVLGFVLLAFERRSTRELLVWAALLYGVSFATMGSLRASHGGGGNAVPGVDVVGMARAAYHGSSYLHVLAFQLFAFPASLLITLVTKGPSALAFFLLGLWAGRSMLLERLESHMLRRVVGISLLAGLAGTSVAMATSHPWWHTLGTSIGSPGLALAYGSGLALLSLSPSGARALAPLGTVGRMALSNYVLQSIICSLLFDGFALGWYETLTPAELLGTSAVIYCGQVLISVWWFRHFQFGPLEWLWRSLTYRQPQPFLREQASAA